MSKINTLKTFQLEKMIVDPAFGKKNPIPDTAQAYRELYPNMAWLFNPWHGNSRTPSDIGKDVFGLKITNP